MKKYLLFIGLFVIGAFRSMHAQVHVQKGEPKAITQTYAFHGTHFMASYKECDVEALTNIEKLVQVLETAVHASGATILRSECVPFDGGGCTATLILSESHASIHTYPEHKSCFVDLFTCGSHCSWVPFDKILQQYLKPLEVEKKVSIRN